MALNIVNRRVEEKSIKVSQIKNVNKTVAGEIDILLEELAELPVLDKRSTDEILDYDENGLDK